MKLTSMIAIYALIWAFSVFLVLPFGVRTTREVGGELVPGQAESAPHEVRMGRIAKRVTIVATLIFAVFLANYEFGWLTTDAFNSYAQAVVGRV
jgi:predicted secreted protein